jgi:hypothetical protein
MENKNKFTKDQVQSVSQEELAKIQALNSEFNKAKAAIADIELQKYNLFRLVDELKLEFSTHEKLLVDKYGANAVINLQTGEVTQKEE